MTQAFTYHEKPIEVTYELVEIPSDKANHLGEHIQDSQKGYKSVVSVQNIPFYDFNIDFIHDIEFVLNNVRKVDKLEMV